MKLRLSSLSTRFPARKPGEREAATGLKALAQAGKPELHGRPCQDSPRPSVLFVSLTFLTIKMMKVRLFSILCGVFLLGLVSCKDKLTGPPNASVSDTIAYWTFNGNLTDITGNGHDLTAVGGSFAADRFGTVSHALNVAWPFVAIAQKSQDFKFTGSDSYSISLWIKTSSDSDEGIISKDDQSNPTGDYQIGIKNGFAYGLVAGAPTIIATGDTKVNDGHWHLITLVVAGNVGASIYTDSIAGGNGVSSFMEPEAGNDQAAFEIGVAPNLSSTFNGIVDDILVRRHAMDPVEVAARFHEGGWYENYNSATPSGWTKGNFGTSQSIQGICFPTPQIGYACGFGGTVLKSMDSGITWTPQNIATTQDLYGISFINPLVGIVGGNNGAAFYTRDGGATWIASSTIGFQQQVGAVENIRDLKFVGPIALMVGGTDVPQPVQRQGFELTSDDSGKTWPGGDGYDDNWMYSVAHMSALNSTTDSFLSTIVGAKGLIRWSDYANSWDGEAINGSFISGFDLFGVDYAGDHGFAVGSNGTIYSQVYSDSFPGSSPWNAVMSGVTSSLRAVHTVNSSEAWSAGDNGVILHTLNDGQTWTRADISGVSIKWNKIVARDANHLAFIGDNGTLYWRTW